MGTFKKKRTGQGIFLNLALCPWHYTHNNNYATSFIIPIMNLILKLVYGAL
jgi:hypothetical protein